MRILIADDERDMAEALAAFVRTRQHEVVATVTTGGLDAIHSYIRFSPDLLLVDVLMPKFNGVTVCRAVLSRNPAAKIVLISGKLDAIHPIVADTGAIAFLSKPVDFSKLDEILNAVEASVAPSVLAEAAA